jgi:hypothetical protein
MQYTFDSCLFMGNTATNNEEQPAASAITMVDSASNLSLSQCCFIDNESSGPATVKIDDTAQGAQISRSQLGDSSLTVNKDNHFRNNTVTTVDDNDSSSKTPSCEDGIYTQGDAVTCTSGTSDCCQANDECQGTRDINFPDSSASIPSLLVSVTLVMMTGYTWMMTMV